MNRIFIVAVFVLCSAFLPALCNAADDDRPVVAFIVSDSHYGADTYLPEYAAALEKKEEIRTIVIHGKGTNQFPDMAKLADADVAVLFIRRLALPKEQLDAFRKFLDRGGALVALRTASHAFSIKKPSPEGCDQWVEFDAEVLGGNYHGHTPNSAGCDVLVAPEKSDHPIAKDLPARWRSSAGLYLTAPIKDDCTVVLDGSAGEVKHPVAWTRKLESGSSVVYVGLGCQEDYKQPWYPKLLTASIRWALEQKGN